jgi:hypothetical protein
MGHVVEEIEVFGHGYVPEEAPSKFRVGPNEWMTDETHLEVRKAKDFPDAIYVSAPYDDQIIFPPTERWVLVRRSVWHRIISDYDPFPPPCKS